MKYLCKRRKMMKLYKSKGFTLILVILILLISVWFFLPTHYLILRTMTAETRQNIIDDLQNVLFYLQQPQKHILQAENLKMQHKLKRIVHLLDGSYTFKEKTTTNTVSPYSCPETFTEAENGLPYFLNGTWKSQKCKILSPTYKIVTIILLIDDVDSCSTTLSTLLESFQREKLENPILIGVPDGKKCLKTSKESVPSNIKIRVFPSSESPGAIWNAMIGQVNTEFTLIGRNMHDYNWFANLKRQVSVFAADPRIKIIGGSVRNGTGHWQVGCYQTRLLDYVLEFRDGYRYSMSECMICHHLLGPFIAKTDFLKRNQLNAIIQSTILFEDFFLKIRSPTVLVLNCPDAMYMVKDPGEIKRVNDKLSWLPVIQKLSLNRVILPDGIVHEFTCEESKMSCKDLFKISGNIMMPLCCMDAFANGLKQFHEFSIKKGILYQLEAGTLMGAVKLRNIIPWDFDGDGSYYEKDKPLFSKELDISNKDGKVLINDINKKSKGFFKVSTPDAFIEFLPLPKLTADVCGLGDVFLKTPTLVRIRGVWVYGSPSPGLTIRNWYGHEYLRHVNSWWSIGMSWYDPYPVTEAFLPCKNPNHHACLDQFDADGNLQFEFI